MCAQCISFHPMNSVIILSEHQHISLGAQLVTVLTTTTFAVKDYNCLLVTELQHPLGLRLGLHDVFDSELIIMNYIGLFPSSVLRSFL